MLSGQHRQVTGVKALQGDSASLLDYDGEYYKEMIKIKV